MVEEGFQTNSFLTKCIDSRKYSHGADIEIGDEFGSGAVFSVDYQKFDDLKNMLDSGKDAMQLDAMKRIIENVAKGKDCSDLFPAVVKTVASKNNEIKKLVYAYLIHYAEQQQDLALLSVSTFQRSLKDSNPLIRASALRVLSSIRIRLVVPIVVLAIKDCARDLSPYVRKTAAHAILKVFSLDTNEKLVLVDIIEQLLGDKTTLVIGSAVQAFDEVCPERLDLIHNHYRKLCGLLMDVDEWGQVALLNMLTRYARTQLPDPDRKLTDLLSDAVSNEDLSNKNTVENHKTPPDDDSDCKSFAPRQNGDLLSSQSHSVNKDDKIVESANYSISEALPLLETDRNNLLNSARYLLQSRNSAVIMAASQLLFSLKARDDFAVALNSLIHVSRTNPEVQFVILSNIATLSVEYKHLLEPHLHSFFVYSTDSIQVKLLKLEILCNLFSETTSSVILHEFQFYVNSPDEDFVTATIRAIGRCASVVPQIIDICLNGLLRLITRPKEKTMAECVIILRNLLQMQTTDHKEIILNLTQMIDSIANPSALAAILWLLGEYSQCVQKVAPDVLRKMAKTFTKHETVVKFQILNLATKLCITNPRQTHTLAQYVFNLAKYDESYDVRDKTRFLRALLFPQSIVADHRKSADHNSVNCKSINIGYLAKHTQHICLATKPAPIIKSEFEDSSSFLIGSLSHLLRHRISGYKDLSDWPIVPPDPWSRVVDITPAKSSTAEYGSPSTIAIHSASTTQHHGDNGVLLSSTTLQDFFSDTDSGESDIDADGENENMSAQTTDNLRYKSLEHNNSMVNTSTCDPSTNEYGNSSGDDIETEIDDDGEEEVGSSDSGFDFQHYLNKRLNINDHLTKSDLDTTDKTLTNSNTCESVITMPDNDGNNNNTKTDPTINKPTDQTNYLQRHNSVNAATQLHNWLNGQSDCCDGDNIEAEQSMSLINEENLNVPSRPTNDTLLPNQLVNFLSTNMDTTVELPTRSDFSSKSDSVATQNTQHQLGTSINAKTFLPDSSDYLQKIDCASTLTTGIVDLVRTAANDDINNGAHNLLPMEFGDILQPIPSVWLPIKNLNPTTIDHCYFLSVKMQFTRGVSARNAKLVVMKIQLLNSSSDTQLYDVYLDFTQTAMGRLLLDAGRVELFDTIANLPPNETRDMHFGIDFAGFCDPVEFYLVYTIGSTIQNWRICVAPLATEFVRPIKITEDSYNVEKERHLNGKLLNHRHLTGGKLSELVFKPSKFVDYVKLHSNMHFLFAKRLQSVSLLKNTNCQLFNCSETYTLTPANKPRPELFEQTNSFTSLCFACKTITEQELCLVEFKLLTDEFDRQQPTENVNRHTSDKSQWSHSIIDLYCKSHLIRNQLCDALAKLFMD